MRTLMLVVVAVLMSGAGTAQGAEADEPIVAAEKQWAKAVVALDMKALEEIYSDDLIYAHSTGLVETKKEYLDKLSQGTQKYALIDHRSLRTKVIGNSAVAHSVVRMKGQSPTEAFDRELMMIHVWVLQGGKWRLVAHQTTKLREL